MVRSLQVELELALNSAGQTCYTVNTIAQWYYSCISFIVIAYLVFHKYLKKLFLFAWSKWISEIKQAKKGSIYKQWWVSDVRDVDLWGEVS